MVLAFRIVVTLGRLIHVLFLGLVVDYMDVFSS